METTLHQQIKRSLARDDESTEVAMGDYRIDAIDRQNRLVEVQFGPLGALRQKVLHLRRDQSLRIVKPIVIEKRIVTLHPRTKAILRTRKSPKRGSLLDVFGELIHFTKCFPHPNVLIDCWLVQVTEHRIDLKARGRRRKSYRLQDVLLEEKRSEFSLRDAHDLKALLNLPEIQTTFCTAWLAEHAKVDRWFAQQIAYVLYHCGATLREGKRGNSHLYRWQPNDRRGLTPALKREKKAA